MSEPATRVEETVCLNVQSIRAMLAAVCHSIEQAQHLRAAPSKEVAISVNGLSGKTAHMLGHRLNRRRKTARAKREGSYGRC